MMQLPYPFPVSLVQSMSRLASYFSPQSKYHFKDISDLVRSSYRHDVNLKTSSYLEVR